MSAPYALGSAVFAIVLSGIIIYATHILPFVVFAGKEPPVIVRFIEKYGASLIMAVLTVYCFKDVVITSRPFGIPHAAASRLTVLLYLKTKNSMITIFSSTALFIVLSRLL